MLRYGAHCGFPNSWAENIYHDAVESGSVDKFTAFLASYDINHKINGNQTGLMIAATNGHIEIVRKFLDAQVQADLTDNQGWTAKDYAIQNGHDQIASLLKLYSSEQWNEINELRRDINGFEHDLANNRSLSIFRDSRPDLIKILARPKYSALHGRMTETAVEDDELIWFGSSECQIALTVSGQNPWIICGRRAFKYQ